MERRRPGHGIQLLAELLGSLVSKRLFLDRLLRDYSPLFVTSQEILINNTPSSQLFISRSYLVCQYISSRVGTRAGQASHPRNCDLLVST